jgi:hypothetical protein
MRDPFEYGQEKAQKRQSEKANEILRRSGALGLSGGLSGGIMGAAGALLATASPRQILRTMGLGALGGAGIASGAGAVGSLVIPDDDSGNVNTRRGGIGGGIVGGVAGAGLGGYAATQKGLAAARAYAPPASALGKLASNVARSKLGPLLGAGIGALGGAGVGAFFGADEGMQYDAIKNEMARRGGEI